MHYNHKKTMKEYIFSTEIAVRDYELDCQGIVNNANYQHYFEHTRHLFCEWAGFSFKEMHESGIDPVVNRIEIDYKVPLRSGDVMISRLWVEMKGARFIFHQEIINKATGVQAVQAVVSCVCTKNGKLTRGEELAEAFNKFFQK